MTALLCALCLLRASSEWTQIAAPAVGFPSAAIEKLNGPLLEPKVAPQKGYAFRYLTRAYGMLKEGADEASLRFRVYSQDESTHEKLSLPVARMLTRLWQMNVRKLGLDHAVKYNRQIVDVYLCAEGASGGEQLFGFDGQEKLDANAIFIYDLKSFTDKVEMAREVAHEYGHATLPPVGIFSDGESWLNGDFGELYYMRYVRDALAANWIVSEDAFGLTLPNVNGYVSKSVDELTRVAALSMPFDALRKKSKAGREAYLGMMLYCSVLLPQRQFGRTLRLVSTTDASDYVKAAADSVEEAEEEIRLTAPQLVRGRAIWIPTGDRKPAGVNVLRRQNGWSFIQSPANGIIVFPARPQPHVRTLQDDN